MPDLPSLDLIPHLRLCWPPDRHQAVVSLTWPNHRKVYPVSIDDRETPPRSRRNQERPE